MSYLIIVAGGRGERAKLGFNKIFARLGRLPLLYWTLLAFERNKTVKNIIVSANKSDVAKIKRLVKKYNFKKVTDIVDASDSRQQSTFEILKLLRPKIKNSDLVGVHNAANPLVTSSEIEKVYLAAKKFGAALLAIAARDTVKITDENDFVRETPIRKYSWYAQTPQVATFGNLWKAFTRADEQRFIGTDDAQLLERVGVKPKIIACSNLNFKITFREDLDLARQILKNFSKNYV